MIDESKMLHTLITEGNIPYEFQVGETYSATDWFTGGTMSYKYLGGNEFAVIDSEADGIHRRKETHHILTDKNGNEYVVLYEYSGHKNCLNAKRR